MVHRQQKLGLKTVVVTLFVFGVCTNFCRYQIMQESHMGAVRVRLSFRETHCKKRLVHIQVLDKKKLNGAASRLLVQFAVVLSGEIYEDHPSDANRPSS